LRKLLASLLDYEGGVKMPKNWNEMSVAAKCDALRLDVQRAFDALNVLAAEARATSSKLNEVAAAVEKLERGTK
jgi:hypothetical protein